LRDGLDVAVPARDRGIDLIAYFDLSSNVKEFVARPIQMKASSEESFSIDRKYKRVANLIIAYVWHVHDPNATVTYALTYEEALAVARKRWVGRKEIQHRGSEAGTPQASRANNCTLCWSRSRQQKGNGG
jgi:hypothetical protein